MTITEPATLTTDYLLAAFTGFLAWRLFGAARRWWGTAFAATAVAGFTGGTVHGFREMLPPPLTMLLWIVTLESLIVAAFAVVGGAIGGSPLVAQAKRSALFAIGGAYAIYGVWVIGTPQFVYAIAAYGAALGVLVAFQLAAWQEQRTSARWLLWGVLVSTLAAAVQQSGFALHEHFNHNDLYHVIQAVAIWMLYRGAIVAPLPARGREAAR
jgi:hypothetical protein